MKKFVVTTAVIGIGLVVGCKEQKDVTYKTAALAAEDGAFDRGWLPKILLPDASDIRESHDLDSNRGEATFQPTEQLAIRVEQRCLRVLQGQQATGPFRLPTSAENDQFRCGDFILVLDMGHKRGYVWH